MAKCIEVGEVFDEVLEALVDSGLYASKAEVVRDALRRLLESIDMRRVALLAYKRGRSFWSVYKMSGVSFEELLSYMVSQGVAPELGCRDVPPAPSVSSIVLDPVGVELMGRLGVLTVLGPKVVLPEELRSVVESVEALTGDALEVRFERVSGYKRAQRKWGVSSEEAATAALALQLGVPLFVCDARLSARLEGVRSVCCYALLRLVPREVWLPVIRTLPVRQPRL